MNARLVLTLSLLGLGAAACAPTSGFELRSKADGVTNSKVDRDYRAAYATILNAATYCIDDSKMPGGEAAARVALTGLMTVSARQTVTGTLDESNRVGRIEIMFKNQITSREAHLAGVEVKADGPGSTITTYTVRKDGTHAIIMAWYNGSRQCPNNSMRTVGELPSTPPANRPAG